MSPVILQPPTVCVSTSFHTCVTTFTEYLWYQQAVPIAQMGHSTISSVSNIESYQSMEYHRKNASSVEISSGVSRKTSTVRPTGQTLDSTTYTRNTSLHTAQESHDAGISSKMTKSQAKRNRKKMREIAKVWRTQLHGFQKSYAHKLPHNILWRYIKY